MKPYNKYRLDNGLEVILSPNDHLHSVSIAIGLNYGMLYESNSTTGVSHLIEHMIFEGTGKFDKKTLKDFLDNQTVYWNGETEGEMTSYKFKLLSLSKPQYVFDIISSMLFNSVFPEDNLKKEKNAVVNEVQSNFGAEFSLEGAIPRAYLLRKPTTTFFGGDPKKIEELSKDTIVDLYSKYYSPSNAVIAIAGNFDTKKVIQSIDNAFGGIKKVTAIPELKAYTGKTKYKSVYMRSFNPYPGQSSIVFGMRIPGAEELYKKSEKGKASLDYIHNILANRLMESLRDNAGLVYLADSDIDISRHTGYLVVYAKTKSRDLEESKKLIFSEIEKIINGDVADKNLNNSNISLKASLADTFDSTLDHSTEMLTSSLKYGRDINQLYKEAITLTLDDVRAAASSYLKTEGQDDSILVISS
ncbi:insulinase family protein [Candidatus Parvarchaeota archaeon]|nr:insulinase family protein [Candidatus Parvarchaeota archaeon]